MREYTASPANARADRSWRKRVAAAVLAAAALALAAPQVSSAANSPLPVIAGPSAALSGYATPRIVLPRGRTLIFRNFDVTFHNVVSKTPNLFASALIGLGKNAKVAGTQSLKSGSYDFICTLHSAMKGVLIVR
jgi:plastocyanin